MYIYIYRERDIYRERERERDREREREREREMLADGGERGIQQRHHLLATWLCALAKYNIYRVPWIRHEPQ